MLLSELLRPGLIKPGLEAYHKEEAIAELLDVLLAEHELPLAARGEVLEALLENEASHGTGMERGVAVPHLNTDRADDILCALGTAPQGIEWGCLDGKPATIIVLLVLPRRNYAGEVRTLAGIENLLENREIHQKIIDSDCAQAIFDLIAGAESA